MESRQVFKRFRNASTYLWVSSLLFPRLLMLCHSYNWENIYIFCAIIFLFLGGAAHHRWGCVRQFPGLCFPFRARNSDIMPAASGASASIRLVRANRDAHPQDHSCEVSWHIAGKSCWFWNLDLIPKLIIKLLKMIFLYKNISSVVVEIPKKKTQMTLNVTLMKALRSCSF